MPTGLWDVATSDATLGDIDIVERADESSSTHGGVVDPDGSVPTADDSAGTGSYDPTTTGTNTPGDVANGVTNWARNIGPDWLDEATLVLIGLALLIALRPYVSLGANATG